MKAMLSRDKLVPFLTEISQKDGGRGSSVDQRRKGLLYMDRPTPCLG